MEKRDDYEYLNRILKKIPKTSEYARLQCEKKWDRLAKPIHSLGAFEDMISRIGGIRGNTGMNLDNRVLLVFCSDNGVVSEGVSQSSNEVTAKVAMSLAKGMSTVCNLVKGNNIKVVAVDMGIKDKKELCLEKDLNKILKGKKRILDRSISAGTQNIAEGPSMKREDCIKAIVSAIDIIGELKKYGCKIVLTGEMGIGNTTTSSAIASVLLDLDPALVTGRGAGLDDEGYKRKIEVIKRAIKINEPKASNPIDVITKIGGYDIAALCGTFIGCAYYRLPVIIDGFISSVAALLAVKLKEESRYVMIASHMSKEPACKMIFEALDLSPVIDAGMHLGEGSGAVMLLSLLDNAINVYNSGHSFRRLGIEPYEKENRADKC
ncbi:MAG: nicotinate-nucleotide--dimethylbenzimidazole phosphoribosyltransferase [Lachnospiraceae bacterium]|nr:nicotinate-nucleotide--dimethylbenzimidazole phosphoribosyltransferase [Lachnospiraceae bacterium]